MPHFRAVRLARLGGPLEDAELPPLVPGEGEIVLAIRAAGICHSDLHYRDDAGRARLPVTLGHEISGVVSAVGSGVTSFAPGDRVALHYLLPDGDMLGKECDGGWAEAIVVPAANAVAIPDEVPFEQAAVMMCSTATAWHALKLSRLEAGESVALLGFGGLGVSAVQLARHLGAERVVASDVVESKLRLAETWGAIAVDARREDFAEALAGADIILDFAGHAPTTLAALRASASGARLVVVGINLRSLEIDAYSDLLAPERSILGSSDHTREELVELMELARRREIDLGAAITRTVPLSARAIDEVLDDLAAGTGHLRSVVVP